MTTSNKGDLAVMEDVESSIAAAVAAGQTLLDADIAAALTGAASPSALNVFATMDDLPGLSADELAAIHDAATPSAVNPFATLADVPGIPYLGTLANAAAIEAAYVASKGRAAALGDFAAATLTDPGGAHLLFATGAATWISVLALVAE